MPVFCITRKKPLDRILQLDELAALAEMLRQWSLIVAGDRGPSPLVYCEARVYAFPRPDREKIRLSLSARLPAALFPECDLDELHVIGPATGVVDTPDLSVWREVLGDPELAHACVLLRMRIAEPPNLRVNRGLFKSNGTTTLALCGAPANGALLLKGLWPVGHNESPPPFVQLAPWPREKRFLEAFDNYLAGCAQNPSDLAAAHALARFGRAKYNLFVARITAVLMRPIRNLLLDGSGKHGPASFLRRLGTAVFAGSALAVGAVVSRDLPALAAVARFGADSLFVIAAWIVVLKLLIIGFNYVGMRRLLTKYYSSPLECHETDLSNQMWPTLLKFDRELELLGARRVCDLSFESRPQLALGRRMYIVDDADVHLTLQNGAENCSSFPPIPTVAVSTRLSDGCSHYTLTYPVYHRWSTAVRTGRCLLNGEGIDEVLATHRREVDKLKNAGAVPIAPENTASAVIERHCREHEEDRELWRASPYSWADAIRQSFEICRREFRPH